MITELTVNGFKSLSEFHLQFNKGINALIGPNGAGKTNICQALGLLASAADGTIAEYILSLGGVPTVFSTSCSIDSDLPTAKTVSVACKGETRVVGEGEDDEVTLRYSYSFSVDFGEEIRISQERFLLSKKAKRKRRFKVILDAERQHGGSDVAVHIKDFKEIGPLETKLAPENRRFLLSLRREPLSSSLHILALISFYCFLAREDMKFSMAWNIDPHLAKRHSDILETHRMLPDGRRLSNAIHALSNSQDDRISEINAFLSRILPGYSKIEPAQSSDGLRTFKMIDSRGIRCAAQSLSDGTIKVLALLVGVLSQQHSTSIIEEPENYLHPWACQLLIEFFRDYFTDGVCIFSTHSETILNSIRPAEIVVVENVDGFTRSRRLSQERELIDAIRASGFGCGYHYIAGSLGGTPE